MTVNAVFINGTLGGVQFMVEDIIYFKLLKIWTEDKCQNMGAKLQLNVK